QLALQHRPPPRDSPDRSRAADRVPLAVVFGVLAVARPVGTGTARRTGGAGGCPGATTARTAPSAAPPAGKRRPRFAPDQRPGTPARHRPAPDADPGSRLFAGFPVVHGAGLRGRPSPEIGRASC